jgi:hypothetical protein
MAGKKGNKAHANETSFTSESEKGNKAAGVRIRKSMQDLKSMAQELRLNVQDVKNS